jgi:hypothetical protein
MQVDPITNILYLEDGASMRKMTPVLVNKRTKYHQLLCDGTTAERMILCPEHMLPASTPTWTGDRNSIFPVVVSQNPIPCTTPCEPEPPDELLTTFMVEVSHSSIVRLQQALITWTVSITIIT